VIRPATIGDTNFIATTWLKSYRAHSSLPSDVFWSDFGHRGLVRSIIAEAIEDGNAIVCGVENSDAILGWLVADNLAIHYVYVRAESRRYGVATQLLAMRPHLNVRTHSTPDVRYLHGLNGSSSPVISPYERSRHAE